MSNEEKPKEEITGAQAAVHLLWILPLFAGLAYGAYAGVCWVVNWVHQNSNLVLGLGVGGFFLVLAALRGGRGWNSTSDDTVSSVKSRVTVANPSGKDDVKYVVKVARYNSNSFQDFYASWNEKDAMSSADTYLKMPGVTKVRVVEVRNGKETGTIWSA